MSSIQAQAADAPESPAPCPTSVYRYYDRIGLLIYVGITKQGMGRNLQHNGKAEWWPLVARQEVEHYPSRVAAQAREKELIRSHRPPFNKQHNPDHAGMRDAYLTYADEYTAKAEGPHDLFRLLGRHLPVDVIHHEPRELHLRSRLVHGPLATLLTKGSEPAVVRGRRRAYGYLTRIERNGPLVSFYCTLRSSKKVRPPEDGIAEAELSISWGNNSNPAYPQVRQVLVTEGDLAAADKLSAARPEPRR